MALAVESLVCYTATTTTTPDNGGSGSSDVYGTRHRIIFLQYLGVKDFSSKKTRETQMEKKHMSEW